MAVDLEELSASGIKKYEMEQLARRLHRWYLLATKKMSPEHYNPKAQKKWWDLTEEQKSIDRYIAEKIVKNYKSVFEVQA